MRNLLICGLVAASAGGLAYSAAFSGKLIDAVCYDAAIQNAPPPDVASKTGVPAKTPYDVAEKCAATASTTSFAFMNTNGKIYKFENASNGKAEAAMRRGALVTNDKGDVKVRIHGEIRKDQVMVRSVTPENR